jgi:hypothetical protein
MSFTLSPKRSNTKSTVYKLIKIIIILAIIAGSCLLVVKQHIESDRLKEMLRMKSWLISEVSNPYGIVDARYSGYLLGFALNASGLRYHCGISVYNISDTVAQEIISTNGNYLQKFKPTDQVNDFGVYAVESISSNIRSPDKEYQNTLYWKPIKALLSSADWGKSYVSNYDTRAAQDTVAAGDFGCLYSHSNPQKSVRAYPLLSQETNQTYKDILLDTEGYYYSYDGANANWLFVVQPKLKLIFQIDVNK